MTPEQQTNNTLNEVLAELNRATTKFPTWPTDPLHALAVLGEEFGASVRFSQDFAAVGTATNPPYRVSVTLPMTGSTTIHYSTYERRGRKWQS